MKKIFVWMLLFSFMSTVPIHALEPDPFAFEEETDLPIIMYHFLRYKNPNKWVITPEEFEADLKYLEENNYHTVVMEDVINFVYFGVPLPDKPVMLTFDDGDSSVHRFVLPLLKKYNQKAVISILGKVTDEYTSENRTDIAYYPNITWPQIKDLVNSGLLEIQNHSYDLHKGIGAKKRDSETTQEYAIRLMDDINKLQQRVVDETGMTPTTFTYPFGAISFDADPILKENGLLASLSCLETVNTLYAGNPDCLFSLGRILRSSGKPISEILEKNRPNDTILTTDQ